MKAVTRFCDEEKRWSFDLPELLDVVLQKGFKIEVDKSRITLPPSGRLATFIQKILRLQPDPPGQPLKCQVVSWRYQVGKTDADSRLEVTLREIKKPWFSRLSPDSQFVAGMIPAVLTVVLGVTAWLLFSQYPAPQEIWVFVGRHIRGLVGWALFLGSVVLALAIRNALASERETWRGMYLNVLLPALGLGAWAYWMYVSEPPQPLTGAPGEYIAYLNYLVSGAKTAWPMLLSAVP